MEQLHQTPARLAPVARANRMRQPIARSAREAGEAPGRRTWLRSMLAIPGIAVVLVLSRTFNVCAAALLAYATFLVSNPTVQLVAQALPWEGRARLRPRHANSFVDSTDATYGGEEPDRDDVNQVLVDRHRLDRALAPGVSPNEWS